MALPSTGAVSVDAIRTEFGLTGSVSFNNLYRGGTVIRDNYGENAKVPTSGELEFKKFRGLYREGTIAQKISAWETYRSTGLMTESTHGGNETLVNYTSVLLNNWGAGPNGPQTAYNTQTTARSSMIATSEWTTIIGISASGGMSNRTSPISSTHTQYGSYTDTHNGNANMATCQINLPFTDIGNVSYSWNRFNAYRWGMSFLILMPGKWEVVQDYSPSGTGWGYNTIGIGQTLPSISMASNELVVHGRERAGDGPSSGGVTGTNISTINNGGWWYNTGNIGIAWNTNGGGSASPYFFNEHPDGTWKFREVS